MRYYLRKLAFYLVAFWAALTLNFFLPRLMPGNPVDNLLLKLSQKGPVSPETRQSVELMLGQDPSQSLWSAYVGYIGQVFSGDFGPSLAYFPTPVADVIGQALPWTIALVGVSTLLSFVFGIILGTLAGWKRGSWLDSFIPVTTMFQAIPYFWLAIILLFFLAATWRVFPTFGGYDIYATQPELSWTFVSSAVYYAILPALTIIISSIGGWILGMRNMMVATLSEDYIVTAEAKGLSPVRIRQSYAARNAMLPSVAGFALSLGFVVSGSIVTEQVFSYPGIGYALLQATQNNDYSLMQGLFLVITLAVLGANLLVDLFYGLIDPRTRSAR
ncbi:ABC transporter permease [Microbacterium sp. NPDC079995]|uniref:ABC transporter permease n=1 Tax=unclassified Microbacterium TaxID=2609290 RepID=UPI00344EB739